MSRAGCWDDRAENPKEYGVGRERVEESRAPGRDA
jgi:hypothetical protein